MVSPGNGLMGCCLETLAQNTVQCDLFIEIIVHNNADDQKMLIER